jgi:hypothetical protein
MNRLTQDEQEAAVRCIMHVERHGGQAAEDLPNGKTAYAYQKSADRIDWGVERRHFFFLWRADQ